ncbi:MAG: helix-turn-helix domain-containing protein [Rhizobiaceae bacterium]|nr:helix-turn-helix domain-containing protein [Rhizobiaceae bacterium]
MAKPRTYKLLCPIARALDRIGDRWTLLILRDLHAGPARFSELQRGLTGIAANLLTERLGKLVEDGLAEKQNGAHGVSLYALTDQGQRTRDILFDLALFGGMFAPGGEVIDPGNMRSIAITLAAACERVASPSLTMTAQFVIDREPMILAVTNGKAVMTIGSNEPPEITLTTSYEALLAVSEGEIGMDELIANQATLIEHKAGYAQEFGQMMSQAIATLNDR